MAAAEQAGDGRARARGIPSSFKGAPLHRGQIKDVDVGVQLATGVASVNEHRDFRANWNAGRRHFGAQRGSVSSGGSLGGGGGGSGGGCCCCVLGSAIITGVGASTGASTGATVFAVAVRVRHGICGRQGGRGHDAAGGESPGARVVARVAAAGLGDVQRAVPYVHNMQRV